ncbi:MAG: DUF3486 family protein [Reyranella sp.]|uniref:phage protein Gp27 family protein n=1 Tax=Reyranella sp. TaxID=1929291 RepID=UPI002731B56E|nr:phage protein Gp27 family protein [Reyranella sp.]MDP1962403.1 DUF3486 family protein [Reyranella sp.]MDP2376543.1 DUF3486 family protein [Reyranella sp.]
MARAARRQPSTIDRLPEAVRDRIAQLRRDGRTIDEIMEALERLGAEVSRSALGRHVKTLAEVGDDMRRAETMARFVVDRFGEDSDERVGRANMRILQAAILELLTERPTDEDGSPVRLDAGEAKALSLTLQRLVASQRVDADRQLKLKAEARRDAAQDAATAATAVAHAQGLTKATADAIRASILGIAA